MNITLRIKRYDRNLDREPYFQEYMVEAGPSSRLLSVLMYVKTYIDGTIAFRKSCGHGICGSDAMVINGTERLACKTLIGDVTGGDNSIITIEPLRGMPVQKDLMVDQTKFLNYYRSVKPFLINDEDPGGKERSQSPEERARFDDPTNCILCAACYSSCPVIQGENKEYIGPAAIVNAARFIFDSRDRGFSARLPVLDDRNGVWPCVNHFNCTKVCPRSIKVTKLINACKQEINKFKKPGSQA